MDDADAGNPRVEPAPEGRRNEGEKEVGDGRGRGPGSSGLEPQQQCSEYRYCSRVVDPPRGFGGPGPGAEKLLRIGGGVLGPPPFRAPTTPAPTPGSPLRLPGAGAGGRGP